MAGSFSRRLAFAHIDSIGAHAISENKTTRWFEVLMALNVKYLASQKPEAVDALLDVVKTRVAEVRAAMAKANVTTVEELAAQEVEANALLTEPSPAQFTGVEETVAAILAQASAPAAPSAG